MRAATYIGDQTFRLEERDPREPGPGEVRVDVAYVGICGTDLHIKHGAMDARVSIPAVIGRSTTARWPSRWPWPPTTCAARACVPASACWWSAVGRSAC
jgi:hypothetical protein